MTALPKEEIRFGHDGTRHELVCDIVAGCDGYWGISRAALPSTAVTVYEKEFV